MNLVLLPGAKWMATGALVHGVSKSTALIIQASLILNNYLTSLHYIEKDSDADLVILRCRKPDYSSKENTCAGDS